MANYYASFRTNYFQVKDLEKFNKWISHFPNIQVFRNQKDNHLIGFGSMEDGVPTYIIKEDGSDEEEVDFIQELSEHLQDGEVAIIQECGSEKLRYLSGHSVAVDSKGEQKWFNINEVYNWVNNKYGKEISRCEY